MENKLIGAKLISIANNGIEVEKEGKRYWLNIEEDYGACCGYNEITTKLLINDNSHPVITKVVKYNTENNSNERCVVTFFGEYKPIAEINTLSSSGSGWAYGACVKVKCKLLEIDETLSSW